MGKFQKIACGILLLVILGLLFSMTPYYTPIEEFFTGKKKRKKS